MSAIAARLSLAPELVIACLVFACVAAAALAAWSILRRWTGADEPSIESRLRALEVGARAARPGSSILRGIDLAEASGQGLASVRRWVRSRSLSYRLQNFLRQAGSAMGTGEFVCFVLLAGAAAGAGAHLAGWQDLRAPVVGLVAAAVPPLWMLRRRAQRFQQFTTQLPDALELMAGSLRAGHAYSSAVQVVGEELGEPIAGEFRLMAEQYRVGLSHRECLDQLLDRVDHPDLRLFAISVLIQTETGGNLAEVLDGLAQTIRSRFRLLGQVRALTAEGRLSGVILAVLPIAVAAILSLLNPRYLDPLLHEKVGHMAIAAAVVLQLAGFLWIRRIVRVRL